jgi:hypothetical protein
MKTFATDGKFGRETPGDPCLWIDVHVGVPFQIHDAAQSDSRWDADKMWTDSLRLFRGSLLLI